MQPSSSYLRPRFPYIRSWCVYSRFTLSQSRGVWKVKQCAIGAFLKYWLDWAADLVQLGACQGRVCLAVVKVGISHTLQHSLTQALTGTHTLPHLPLLPPSSVAFSPEHSLKGNKVHFSSKDRSNRIHLYSATLKTTKLTR